MPKSVRTNAETDAEVAALRGLLERVPQFTAFGDDNHAAIEAQIEVLEENLDQDDVDERFDESAYLLGAAQDALNWIEGIPMDSGTEKPSDDWAALATPVS